MRRKLHHKVVQDALEFEGGFSNRRSFSLSPVLKNSRGIGRVAGPRFTFPSRSNSLPWHGHSKSPRVGFHFCRHPRCVQRSSNAVNCSGFLPFRSHAPASGTCNGMSGRSLSRTSLGTSLVLLFPILKNANLPSPPAPITATRAANKNNRDLRKNRLSVAVGSVKAVSSGEVSMQSRGLEVVIASAAKQSPLVGQSRVLLGTAPPKRELAFPRNAGFHSSQRQARLNAQHNWTFTACLHDLSKFYSHSYNSAIGASTPQQAAWQVCLPRPSLIFQHPLWS